MKFSFTSSSSLTWRRVASAVSVVTTALTLYTFDESYWDSDDPSPIVRRRASAIGDSVEARTFVGANLACPARNLPTAQEAFVPPEPVYEKYVYSGPEISRKEKRKIIQDKNSAALSGGCFRYECSKQTEPHCKDNLAETDYAGDRPPCCAHVLRDLLRATDDALCGLGLEYFLAYGALLGLVRDDHVIPWTADNDYVVSFAVAEEIWKQRDHIRENHGVHFFIDKFFRACASGGFMGGVLERWETPIETTGRYDDYLPYSDFFLGNTDPVSGQFIDERGCAFDLPSYSPPTRLMVYNQTFGVSIPRDFALVLESCYGPDWKTPPEKPSHHGKRCCPQSKFTRVGLDPQWKKFWDARLSQARVGAPSQDGAITGEAPLRGGRHRRTRARQG